MKIKINKKKLLSILLAGGITLQLSGCVGKGFSFTKGVKPTSSFQDVHPVLPDTDPIINPPIHTNDSIDDSFAIPEEDSYDEPFENDDIIEDSSFDVLNDTEEFNDFIIEDHSNDDSYVDIATQDGDSFDELIEEDKPYDIISGISVLSSVNVRSGPSTNYSIIGGLTPGSKFPLLSHDNNWYQIDYFGESAYIYDEYAEECSYITGLPLKVVCFSRDVSFTSIDGEEKTLPYCEAAFVYDEDDQSYLVSCNHQLGYVSKNDCITLEGVFAIIDKSDQRVDIYRDNELLLSSPCVTGKDSSPTDTGLHEIWFINHDTYLTGPGYSSYVNHFLAFNGGEGLHDASWRSIFGTNDYHSDGSHGCVNLPISFAEEVNNTMSLNDKVLVKE